MVVGSLGSIAYGEHRSTHDIDILLDMQPRQVADFVSAFPVPEYYISEDAIGHAIQNRFQFNVLHNETGLKIDFIFPRDDEWGRSQLNRREQIPMLPGRLVNAGSREDIILGKLIYYAEGQSDKHLRDIKGILSVSGDLVNRKEIERWAEKLNVLDIWNMILMLPDAPT